MIDKGIDSTSVVNTALTILTPRSFLFIDIWCLLSIILEIKRQVVRKFLSHLILFIYFIFFSFLFFVFGFVIQLWPPLINLTSTDAHSPRSVFVLSVWISQEFQFVLDDVTRPPSQAKWPTCKPVCQWRRTSCSSAVDEGTLLWRDCNTIFWVNFRLLLRLLSTTRDMFLKIVCHGKGK